MNWIISANSNMYDHSSSFDHHGSIDWRQGNVKYEIGDKVFIYCTRPLMMIQYKCIVERIGLNSSQIRDDNEYWFDEKEYYKSLGGKFMTLRLIEQVSNNEMKLENLLKNGLKAAPQGPMKILNETLQNYIDKFFTDNNQIDFFPETIMDVDTQYEGAKKSVVVNKYERSSKARENAVKYHGFNCKVCQINFKDKYGKIGEDFIHIHHIIPINEIGKNYKVDYKKDLIPVCPNCHSMLHRKINGKEPTIDELKQMILK